MAPNCDLINMNMIEDDHMIFRSYKLSSWKGMCRYYSGDSDCIPNMNLVKYSSNIDELETKVTGELAWLQDLAEYTINPGDTMNSWDDAKEMLQICEMNKYQNSECDSINLDKYLVFANEMSGDWNTKTISSKCAEIGYLLGIKCQNSSNDTECEPVDCPGLLNNTDPSYHAAGEFCRELGCGKTERNVAKCDFLNGSGTYTVHESWNDSYGLVNMENKCKNEYLDESHSNRVLDFSYYNTATYNFTLNATGDENLCIFPSDINLANGNDNEQHCQLIGAQKGVFTKFTPGSIEPGSCEVNNDEGEKCAAVTFKLPNFISNDNILADKFIPNPSELESEDDFGVKLCEKLNCKATRIGDDVTCAPHCTGNNDCNSQGTCTFGTCNCNDNYSGDNCEVFDVLCVDVECNGHGNCSAGTCNCNNGWFGDNCDIDDALCVDVDCNDHGTCGAGGICNCNDGWSGQECDNVVDNPCDGVQCNEGICSAGTCECNNGWSGDNCDIDDTLCVDVECNDHGTCSAGICECDNGWSGKECENVSQAVIQFGMALLAIALF